jgi:hypothetical protein
MPQNYQDKKKPFDATTQGLGRNEMIRRTRQHNILATKKYEESLRYDVGIDAAWVARNVSGNEMNPWVMKEISNLVSHTGTRDKLRKDALKMWHTAGSFEVGTPIVRKTNSIATNRQRPTKSFLNKQINKTIRKIENPIGYVYNTIKNFSIKASKASKGYQYGGQYKSLDLSTNKTGKYGVDY